MHPGISVFMPVRDVRPYVAQAIDSILEQSFADFELIIVDDGSTDGTREVLEAYARRDRRIVVDESHGRGVSAAANRGLELCRAPLVARMDGDDVAAPERLAAQYAFMEAHPEIVASGTGFELMDEDGVRLGKVTALPLRHEEIDARLMRGTGGICNPSAIHRREAVLALGGYRSSYDWVEDQDLFLRLAERGRLANLPDVLMAYRQRMSGTCLTRQDEQRVLLRGIVEEAYRRRGLEPPDDLDAQLPVPPSQLHIERLLLKRAIKARNGRASFRHARLLLQRDPWSWHTWRTLPRLFKPGLVVDAWSRPRPDAAALLQPPPAP